jgi:hypothetical protein
MPTYYITLIASIIWELYCDNYFADYASITQTQLILTWIGNALGITSWFVSYSWQINIPSWTIGNFLFFWLLFPYLLRYLVQLNDQELLKISIYCSCLKLIVLLDIGYCSFTLKIVT